ncbi:hypothetical protein BB558_003495 [Smittium angustum]|uniref:Nuclear control of ATPase protein 2 n=1 Tax=Smittium angustum TaxID=133377 RepID=A0A2U1J5Z3_SMIAN|nr:hypothetical protein BB558_003495 [Smittium angustum]
MEFGTENQRAIVLGFFPKTETIYEESTISSDRDTSLDSLKINLAKYIGTQQDVSSYKLESTNFSFLRKEVQKDLDLIRSLYTISLRESDSGIKNNNTEKKSVYNKQDEVIKILCGKILGRSISILNAQISQILVEKSILAIEEKEYWQVLSSSRVGVLYHTVSTLPQKLIAVLSNSISNLIETVRKFVKNQETVCNSTKNLNSIPQVKNLNDLFNLITRILRETFNATHLKSVYGMLNFGEDSFKNNKIFSHSTVSTQHLFNSINRATSELSLANLSLKEMENNISYLDLLLKNVFYRIGELSFVGSPKNHGYIIEDKNNNPDYSSADTDEYESAFLLNSTRNLYSKLENAVRILHGSTIRFDSRLDQTQAIATGSSKTWEDTLYVLVQKIELIQYRFNSLSVEIDNSVYKYSRPNVVSRTWIPTIAVGLSSYYFIQYVGGHKETIKDYIIDLGEIVLKYYGRYIFDPLKEAYNTIRYGGQIVSVVSSNSLESSVKSLQLMTINLLESQEKLTEANRKEIMDQISSGDITSVMSLYAREIKSPIYNALFGDLIPSILIQVQKANVDIQQALTALDKLLRSNELNFVFLAVAPASVFAYALGRIMVSVFDRLTSVGDQKSVDDIKLLLRDIDVLINKEITGDENQSITHNIEDQSRMVLSSHRSSLGIPSDTQRSRTLSQGMMLCYTERLRRLSAIIPEETNFWRKIFLQPLGLGYGTGKLSSPRRLFLEDVRDLENNKFNVIQRYNVLNRMYRTHKFLQR